MYVEKNDQEFRARLKDDKGTFLEDGVACVNVENRSIEFKNDFVPLYPIGTPLQITRLYEQREIHIFTGKVYISDKNLLRLVSVNDTVVPGSEDVYACPVSIGASLTLVSPKIEPPPRKFFLFRNNKDTQPVKQTFDITIHSICSTQLRFHAEPGVPINEEFYMTMNTDPIFKGIPVVVTRVLEFGNTVKCQGVIGSIDFSEKEPFQEWIKQLNSTGNQFFKNPI